jgi:hypothetical protein
MTKTPIAVAVLACCIPFAVSAAPSATHHGQAQAAAAVSPDATCASNAGTDTGNAIVSQDFTDSGYDIYDSEAADDFTLSAPCVANGLSVTGQFFNGSGPADSLNITYYKNKSSHPGKVVKALTGLDASTGPSFNVKHGKVKLKAGHFWVSPQVVMAFGGGTTGEWGWEVQTEESGVEANWQNPGGGFGVCPSWDTITNCIGVSGDFMFTVKGK